MELTQPEALRELLRRVDEVRGLSESAAPVDMLDPGRPDALLKTLKDLVQELERGHRRLIETNVQLVSLREVVGSIVDALDSEQTTRVITRYLSRAFGFEEVLLLLINRESGQLEGTWTHLEGERQHSHTLALPLVGQASAWSRAVWLDRTVVQQAAGQQLAAALPHGHPLQEVLEGLGSIACAPLQRGRSTRTGSEAARPCDARCIMEDASLLVPPPGSAARQWAQKREEHQRRCLACEFTPVLGLVGVGRRAGGRPLSNDDLTQLESIALSVAPVVENARLYQELRKSERFREHVLDSMSSALVAVNMKGEILTFNRAAESLLGFSEAEVLGKPFGAEFGSDGETVIADALEQGREVLRAEATLRARSGAPVPVSLTTSLLRNERRAIYGAITTFDDLTSLKRAEEHARRLDRLAALGRFTSSVAHEIRNPLAGIASGIQYLARSLGNDGRQAENLSFIQNEIRRLDRIVQDLFDVTHPRGLQLEAAPVEEAVRRALCSLQPFLKERRISVRTEVEPRTPPFSHDVDQIQQVFINLIKNAAEASPAGSEIGVAITAIPSRGGSTRETRTGMAPGVAVGVEDHGSGITPEHLKTIFEPFFTTKPGGTGLGLYITHDIVKRHGGSLTVTSEPGHGTRFLVELPLEHNGGTP